MSYIYPQSKDDEGISVSYTEKVLKKKDIHIRQTRFCGKIGEAEETITYQWVEQMSRDVVAICKYDLKLNLISEKKSIRLEEIG